MRCLKLSRRLNSHFTRFFSESVVAGGIVILAVDFALPATLDPEDLAPLLRAADADSESPPLT
jgi:hypothetical protein